MTNPILVVMAKEPKVGSTKTRLCPPLSFDEAAGLYEALLFDTLDLCSSLKGIDLAVAVTPPESTRYFERICPQNTLILPVACVDIGDCLRKVLGEMLIRGYPKVLALNSDGPTLPPEYIQRSVRLLSNNDLVLGPGEDGGYYLIGLKALHKNLFNDIEWSTSRVLTQTLARAEIDGLRVGVMIISSIGGTAGDLLRLSTDLETISPERLTHTRRYLIETLSGFGPK